MILCDAVTGFAVAYRKRAWDGRRMSSISKEPFFFGIPLIAQAAASDWSLVNHLFGLMLCSLLAQGDREFRVVLAGHEVPPAWRKAAAGDGRFLFLQANWAPEPPTTANDDGGRKKWLITNHVRQHGGGLLMFVDADDWVDRDLVRMARECMGPDVVAALIGHGYAFDLPSGRAAAFPINEAFEGAFHELCGSSTIARIRPNSPDPVLVDPHGVLGWHGGWDRVAEELGIPLVRLNLLGTYVVGTEQSHSECAGPHATWKRGFAQAVRRSGRALDFSELQRFGLTPSLLT